MNFQRGIKFQSLVEFRAFLPEEERVLADVLRGIVLDVLPASCHEKLTYNVPFFYGKRRICFVWPAAVPWGGFTQGVMLGFCHGPRISDPGEYLSHGTNKQLYYTIFNSATAIDEKKVTALLRAAVQVDERFR